MTRGIAKAPCETYGGDGRTNGSVQTPSAVARSGGKRPGNAFREPGSGAEKPASDTTGTFRVGPSEIRPDSGRKRVTDSCARREPAAGDGMAEGGRLKKYIYTRVHERETEKGQR